MAKKKASKKTISTRAAGRPTKKVYDPAFCDMLIDHMSYGFSFASFAGVVGVSRSTLYEWLSSGKYPEFEEAKEIAEDKCLLFWEGQGINLACGISRGSASVYVFNMANRFHKSWKLNRDAYELQAQEKANESNAFEIKLTYDPAKLTREKDSEEE